MEERIKVQGKQIEIYKAHIERFESEKEKEVEGDDVVGSISQGQSSAGTLQRVSGRKSLTPRGPRADDLFFSFKDGSDAVVKSTIQRYP